VRGEQLHEGHPLSPACRGQVAAFEGYPEDVPIKGFDPRRDIIENVLG
jgi:hypothetical protein